MKKIAWIIIMLVISFWGCAPEYLDIKPNKALVVPDQLNHFQALLDAATVAMNQGPGIQVLSGDEFYHPGSNLNNLNFIERNSYLWSEYIYEGRGVLDWEYPYKAIFNANIVLDGLGKIKPDAVTQKQWNHIYGSALFYRACMIFHMAAVFAAPYDESTAASLPGIPVRLTMDVNEITGRGTLKYTYEKVINDLIEADKMLSPEISYIHRPSGAAVKALLARIYLSMRKYDKALEMASASLQIHNKLLNYNTLNPSAARPFPSPFSGNNPEIIFHYNLSAYGLTNSTLTGVDSVLYKSYNTDDLRKTCFFVSRGNDVYGYKGSYSGGAGLWGGLTTDESYLIRAECYAREKKTDLALADLNLVLKSRFVKDKFVDLTATDATILDLVLMERRKELFGRGLRWSDLRRLNKEPEHAITLTRMVNGEKYVLTPNHNRYVFPIPDDEIRITGIEQNPR